MVTIFIRTLIIYTILLISMRLMGKRQIGQLEVTDLVTTFMLSEIATLPIENPDMPLVNSLIPIIILLTFEVASSMLMIKAPRLKSLFSSRPGYLIKNGVLIESELIKNRISSDELISELRQNGISDIDQADYAIMEKDGKITVLPKPEYRPITPFDLGLNTSDDGLSHIIISNGIVNSHGLSVIGKSQKWLDATLSKDGYTVKDIFLMTSTDSGRLYTIPKAKKARDKTK